MKCEPCFNELSQNRHIPTTSVASVLKTIFKERKPEKMWVEKGKEFYNKDVKDLIELYSTENEEKSSLVERWIRTMKEKMWKYFSVYSTNVYINALPDLVREYNIPDILLLR